MQGWGVRQDTGLEEGHGPRRGGQGEGAQRRENIRVALQYILLIGWQMTPHLLLPAFKDFPHHCTTPEPPADSLLGSLGLSIYSDIPPACYSMQQL